MTFSTTTHDTGTHQRGTIRRFSGLAAVAVAGAGIAAGVAIAMSAANASIDALSGTPPVAAVLANAEADRPLFDTPIERLAANNRAVVAFAQANTTTASPGAPNASGVPASELERYAAESATRADAGQSFNEMLWDMERYAAESPGQLVPTGPDGFTRWFELS